MDLTQAATAAIAAAKAGGSGMFRTLQCDTHRLSSFLDQAFSHESSGLGLGGDDDEAPEVWMSEDVVIGDDGRPRCSWAGQCDAPAIRYHDDVWGTRTYDQRALFEALTLGVFQAGLSWRVVFNKRHGFRHAFHDFDVEQVAAISAQDVDRLVGAPSIVRNRAKIQATIENARAIRSAVPSLAELAKAYAETRESAPRSLADLPTSTPHAESFATQLKAQGYHFVGPTSVYAFMQNIGVVNDHIHGCFRAVDYRGPFPDKSGRARGPRLPQDSHDAGNSTGGARDTYTPSAGRRAGRN